MLAIDTETTGIDFGHGTKPFFITTCDENQEQDYWEWDVDPITREPIVDADDLEEFHEVVERHDSYVFQNPVFDTRAIETIDPDFIREFDWSRIEDTLTASHIVSSNTPHDLTSLAYRYLGINVQKYEDAVKEAVDNARALAKFHLPEWRIAKPGLKDMPSIKTASSGASKTNRGSENESYWKADMWLPRAFVKNRPDLLPKARGWKEGDDPEDHPWATVCAEYANPDTAVTITVHDYFQDKLEQLGMMEIYRERLKLLPIIHQMSNNGMTFSLDRLNELKSDYAQIVSECSEDMVEIAKAYDYELEVPKGANNASLVNFCFGYEPTFKGNGEDDCHVCGKNKLKTERGMSRWYGPHQTKKSGMHHDVLLCSEECKRKLKPGKWLDLPVVSTSKKTGNPSLDKVAIAQYAQILDEGSDDYDFVNALATKRKLGKSIEYMESYERFMIPWRGSELWHILHPSLNQCGTDTLRWSSHNPSQQVISKQKDHNGRSLRYIFGPGPGREWFALDYDNLELRLPAFECGEPAMLELFLNPDKAPYYGSYHLLIFSILHPDKYDHDDPDGLLKAKDLYASTWYQWTKNGNFAELYGAVDTGDGAGTADRAFRVPGAQAIIAKKLKEKNKLNRKYINLAKKYGYVETMPDRTVNPKRGYPLQCKRGTWGQIVETVPLNYHVQGTACWVIMRAMIEVQKLLDKWNTKAGSNTYRMIMNIHDELVFDFPKPRTPGGNESKIRQVRKAMEDVGDDLITPSGAKVILTCGLDYHPETWATGVAL